MKSDVILITIDCWRYDALERMETLQAACDDYHETDIICTSACTRGSFPSILSGQYYPNVYQSFTKFEPNTVHLPQVLRKCGYTTGAVVGSNPFLSAWRSSFDYFWNDDLELRQKDSLGRSSLSLLTSLNQYARFTGKVDAETVISRGQEWYEQTDGPRFMWVHFMDIHVPFLPGFRRALKIGLMKTVQTHLKFNSDPASLDEKEYETLERLYWMSIDYLDNAIRSVFEFIDDDAVVVVTGDHGEEFDHELYGHARLYDECIRTPLLVSDRSDVVREGITSGIDLPKHVLQVLDQPIPDEWDQSESNIAYSMNHSPELEEVYFAARTDESKLIFTYDENQIGTVKRKERYDLTADPNECENVYDESTAPSQLESKLTEFITTHDMKNNVLEYDQSDISNNVQERLKHLGYK